MTKQLELVAEETDHDDLVAGAHQPGRVEEVEGVEGKAESASTAPATPSAAETG